MESSEDDAGTATNASRRTSAREKDVGLAEDINATSSFHQKSSEAQMSCQTPSMSEDNFDGDSVPSPSSQDVNTSTEAILDMIDEIVDGPGAPKRLQQASEVVEGLNEELATASNNLNNIQEATNSDCEKLPSIPEQAMSSSNTYSKIVVSVGIDLPAECSSVVSIDHTINDSVPAITSASEDGDNILPIDSISKVDNDTSGSYSLSNLPSNSEEKTVKNVCESQCESSQNRTIKCVISSDNQDSVTVESAESTSSDNSVCENKVLHVEPQTWSPLRRRLVRPVPSDRRPDYTVSSTVDNQTVNIPATKPTSDNITKDVTSSSDAVPIVHSNVKPEEIRIVSEINVCKAETSVSPSKKIKLIRQKNVTGASNRAVSLDQINVSEKEPCQSTSHDSDLVNLPIPTIKPSIAVNLSKLQDDSKTPNYVSESLPEPSLESSLKVCSTEHSQLNIELLKYHDRDSSNKQIDVEQSRHTESDLPSSALEFLATSIYNVEETIGSPEKNSPKHVIGMNYLEQGKVCNTHDNENRELDYIPLCLPAKNDECQSKTTEFESKNKEYASSFNKHDSKNINLHQTCKKDSSINELKSTAIESKHELESENLELQSKSMSLCLKSNQLELKKTEFQSRDTELESKSDELKGMLSENKSLSTKIDSNSRDTLSTTSETVSKNLENKSTNNESEIRNSDLETKSKMQSEKGEIDINNKPSSCETSSKNSMLSKIDSKSSELVTANINQETNAPTELKTTESKSDNSECESCISIPINCEVTDKSNDQDDQKKVPPIKLNLSRSSVSTQSELKLETEHNSIIKNNVTLEDLDTNKQVPKLTIKLKQSEQPKSPGRKVTIKALKHSVQESDENKKDNFQEVRPVAKLNIKPIIKPEENIENQKKTEVNKKNSKEGISEQISLGTKLKVHKPPEKINDIHRKSSSSEISESEYSENDETTSTSDQASASDNGSTDVVPKVTIKLGKPGTESEGKFYTEKNIPKLTIKGIQQDEKVIISHSEDVEHEKVPKLTIKTVPKIESQPLSPKLTVKHLKPPDPSNKEGEIPKMKLSTESSLVEAKESLHVPKITIKTVTRMDCESRTPKKSAAICDGPEHIPVVTKLNIKPILKPIGCGESSEDIDERVPVVSKLNIKPVVKPKDIDINSSVDDVPKITKLNIKPLKNPEENFSEYFKDFDDLNADVDKNSIPVVTKINIKPVVKPQEENNEKDSENLSSETGNSSDENADNIPVVTKLNIKPIVKPDEFQESSKSIISDEQSIPIITKLNIKPLVKPVENSPLSPKKEHTKVDIHSTIIPVVTKINIKPIVKPEEIDLKSKDDSDDRSAKNPPLVMKINMKSVTDNVIHENSDSNTDNHKPLQIPDETETSTENKLYKSFELENVNDSKLVAHSSFEKSSMTNCVSDSIQKIEDHVEKSIVNKKSHLNMVKLKNDPSTTQHLSKLTSVAVVRCDSILTGSSVNDSFVSNEDKIIAPSETHKSQEHKNINLRSLEIMEGTIKQPVGEQKTQSLQNCTLLKKLLENTRDNLDKQLEVGKVVNCVSPSERSDATLSCKNVNSVDRVVSEQSGSDKTISRNEDKIERMSITEKVNDYRKFESNILLQELKEKVNESVTKPLEISTSDKITNQDSGQDSPRIILKINKTDHGPLAKIITEDIKRTDHSLNYVENAQDNLKQSPKKLVTNSRKKQTSDTTIPSQSLSAGKRLRSSRIIENTEKSQSKKNVGKRLSPPENTQLQNKESDLSILQSKRMKLGQLLSGSNVLTIKPVPSSQTSPPKTLISPTKTLTSPTKTSESKIVESKSAVKTVNHSLLSSENCSKNGNSKLHNILSNLQAKQMQSLSLLNTNCTDKLPSVSSDIEHGASISNSDSVDVPHTENSHPELQQMIINENSEFRDLPGPEDTSQDPLEVESLKPPQITPDVIDIPILKPVELTPQPRKRGRPRKLPASEGAKPAVVTLPVPALEERPQRSLRLMRERPMILQKPRGRGRGRGARRLAEVTPSVEPVSPSIEPKGMIVNKLDESEGRLAGEIDPMSSRIKLPRMTEALYKMPSVCMTPLSSRRRNSSENFSMGETSELKVILDSTSRDDFPNTPEPSGLGRRGRGGRGSRGGRGRTPRGRGRGRGGGRGAMYMKETMGIYGRVCGPATTTVQLFEEETCMMDDNATPVSSRPSHLLDDDSQSSVKSSTNESSKMKKSKFADLFDSNKVWTAADVKEYTWPPPDKADVEHSVMMIQEQVAMFLGVKSFKRRYPELKRRTICGEERDYVLSKGLATEALCELGITAVDASDVLDIMLSDYPHKYEEFRSHQRQRQLTEVPEETVEEPKQEEKVKVEVKTEKSVEQKPELPKIDPEKTRQDMAAAAIASASEWNARANAARRGACADLQSLTILRARPPQVAPSRPHLCPPAGFYPHALLPGQYQHTYRVYTPEQLRYFPLNTVLAAPPAPPSATESSSDSEPDWASRCSSSEDSDVHTHHSAKRKKLSKVKRVSHIEPTTSSIKEEPRDEVVDTCRVCKLRLEANRKYTHERFLVCANCNAKLHPACIELNADTIRKCREYPWQCAECKTCYTCRQPADDDKMLFCDLCDRGFHIYCVGLDTVPSGRWHCVECAICKSCGARTPSGIEAGTSSGSGSGGGSGSGSGAPPAEWHHQTKRGPGGHKVYSHSLCTPCARAYRIGRYCPLCERSFIGPKGTMQLVICKLCDRQLHQECVKQSGAGAALRVLDYTCAECRRGGITSRAAAVRLAPRTIATLFMAKRRFNKYAHRQYMESRMRANNELSADVHELSADAHELSADAHELSVDAPDLSIDAPDPSADASE